MELRFPRQDLQPALQRISALVPSNGTPTLTFEGHGSYMGMTLSEAQFSYRAGVKWSGVFEPFGVSAKLLLGITRTIRDEVIVLTVDRDEAKLKVTTTTSEYEIPLLEPELIEIGDYEAYDEDGPEDGHPIHATLTATDLSNALRRLKYAVGTESGRPYLMALDVQHGRCRACDGWKYHEINLRINDLTFSVLETGLDTLLRVLRLPHWEAAGVTFYRTVNGYLFDAYGDLLLLPKLNVEFPDLDSVLIRPLKTKIPSLLRINREDLISGLKQVRLLTDKDRPAVEMYLTADQMVLRTSRTNANAVTKVPARWAAQSRTAYFDVNSLLDFLVAYGASGDIELRFANDEKDARGPVVAEGDDSWAMLNQLKITDLRS